MVKRGDVSLKAERTVRESAAKSCREWGPSGDGEEGKNEVMLRSQQESTESARQNFKG